MAKAKAKAKAKVAPATLPNGYKTLSRAPSWDLEKFPVVQGIRGETTVVTVDKGTDDERDQRICVVRDKVLGEVTVWESSMLKDFFDKTDAGADVRLEFLGYGDAKPGQNPPKMFSVGVKSKAPF